MYAMKLLFLVALMPGYTEAFFGPGLLSHRPPSAQQQLLKQPARINTALGMDAADSIAPALIMLGAVAATFYKYDKPNAFDDWAQQLADSSKEMNDKIKETEKDVVELATRTQDKEPAVVMKVETNQERVLEPTPVASAAPLAAVAVPMVTVATEEPPGLSVTTTTPLTVQQVAMTKQGNEKTKALADARKAELAKTAITTTTTVLVKNETQPETVLPKKGKKRTLVLRVIKKVVAPWRKWNTIK
jgi:hypothetical protein